ncbi:hypothetical protein PG993_014611 [Apiospora rasikravindrae]|uniref:Uncharacterized protein n=1 Tax=Apiospora rasikravindrae TaxID=990691 RepID=A0ABR1RNH2_9PEZI
MSNLPQDGSIPSMCYASCKDYTYRLRTDDAYLEAQQEGKGPTLCSGDGPFQQAYAACVACAQEHASQLRTNDTYLAPGFAQYIDYCDMSGVLVTIILSAPVGNIILYETKTTRIDIPANFTATVTATTSGLSNIRTAADSTLATISPGTSTGSGQPTSIPDSGGGRRSQAWIAGPVLGSLAGAAIILVTVIFLFRRRKKLRIRGDDEPGDKSQLHSDCIPKPELENSEKKAPIELPGTDTAEAATQPHELPDIQNPAELEAPTTTAQEQSGQLDTANDRQGS